MLDPSDRLVLQHLHHYPSILDLTLSRGLVVVQFAELCDCRVDVGLVLSQLRRSQLQLLVLFFQCRGSAFQFCFVLRRLLAVLTVGSLGDLRLLEIVAFKLYPGRDKSCEPL
jgi:hypothetical protein